MNVEHVKEIEPKFSEYPYDSHREGSWSNGLCSLAEARFLGYLACHWLYGTQPEAGFVMKDGKEIAFALRTRYVSFSDEEVEGYDFGWDKFYILSSKVDDFEGRLAIDYPHYPIEGNYRTRKIRESFDASVEELVEKVKDNPMNKIVVDFICKALERVRDEGGGELSYREMFDYLVLDFESCYFKNA